MFNRADFSLRPLAEGDRELLLRWRNSERVRANMYTDHLIGEAEHNAWFSKILTDSTVWYRVFMYKNRPIGLAYAKGNEWGFYIGEKDAPRGCGAVLELMAIEALFGQGFEALFCEVLTTNEAVIRLHGKFGFVEVDRLSGRKGLIDAVRMELSRGAWNEARKSLTIKLFGEPA